ncbi:CDP-alcohol phosphatidyltransferase family protein [Actinobacteria bacterium YIM 96077]|uniref:Phosphatidylinositol phosphate synthase n=1 Tax=Phytoactinopolyspora halophila TaxID=1981511 RepID=A0A329R370_9ACTN|nr:CDP-alcohol phosphatidyltransferase family protein [Phytoactinopolyspora halophila]AYY13327.1 CDP-alcohol phosphatidyltransferase family protein [Actinobacteria bacterium YIM 96077]RAW17438.1 CDP-alcohol phosphatidyltransferase family protein [Phytoactinopolyspora halophila]
MLDKYTRVYTTRILTPAARALLKLRIGPDAVTIAGTLGVTAGAFAFYPRGEFLWGTLVITAFIFADNIDGIMARLADRRSQWGAFLDSVLDRVGDAAIFGALALWFAGEGANIRMTALLIACLAFGAIVSYARARAESLGYTASGGIAERADRLVALLVTTGLVGLLGLPVVVLEVVLWLLMGASAWTVVQRVRYVRRQAVQA